MRLAFVLIMISVLGLVAYYGVKYIIQYGILDLLIAAFIVAAIIGTAKLINYARSGNHF